MWLGVCRVMQLMDSSTGVAVGSAACLALRRATACTVRVLPAADRDVNYLRSAHSNELHSNVSGRTKVLQLTCLCHEPDERHCAWLGVCNVILLHQCQPTCAR